MGQSFSRRLTTRLEEGLQRARQEMDRQMKEEVRNKIAATKGGYTDPRAMQEGFQRGASATPRELMQQEFLETKSKNHSTEMPEDLVQFLRDVGPLERKLDEKFTSPKLRERIKQGELEQRAMEEDLKRTTREMPIMGNETDFVTTRTTNFSTLEDNPNEEFGITDVQLYELLAGTSDDNAATEEIWTKITSPEAEHEDNDKEKRSNELKMLEICKQYLTLPQILKDTDDTYIGVNGNHVAEMQRLKLKVVPESCVKIVLASLHQQKSH